MSKAEKIKKTIKKIDSIISELNKKGITDKDDLENYFWKKESEIMNTYPFLVCQIISGADRNMLDYMINTIEQIESGNKEQSNADVEIGQKIVDDYIKPQLD